MQFRVLGPLEVAENGHTLELGGPKERALLAVLLLHANETVSTERLVDELWGEAAPPSAPKVVSTYVWQLRKNLADRIVTRPRGYAAVVAPDELDVTRFEQLVERAQREEPVAAAETLREALALWRGAPLDDVPLESFARQEAERLEDQRLTALAQRIDHDLALGRHEAVASELQALVRDHPYRERFHAQLMLALYRSGRQADALAVYRDVRRRFVDELGIDPGPELQQLERAILDHDPAIAAPVEFPRRERAPETQEPDRRRGPRLGGLFRRRRFAVAVAAGTAAAAAAAAFATVTREDRGLTRIAPNSVGLIDPETAKIVREIPVRERPVALDAAAGALWVANYADDSVTRIDEASGATDTIPVGGHPTAVEADANGLWVLRGEDRRLVRVDRRFGYRAGPAVRLEATSLAASGSALWVTQYDTTLQRFDVDGRRRGSPLLLDAGARLIVASDDGLWVAGPRALTRVDPRTGIPSPPIDLLGVATALTVGAGSVWAAVRRWDPDRGVVQKIDADEQRVAASANLGSAPRAVTVARGYVWVATPVTTISRLRASDLSNAGVVELGARPSALAAGREGLWVAAE